MALEQTEIKKVITVDLGNTSTSLKDYKKHIDELKGSLLQLDSASEEYQKIAQEVKNEQDKLNEVMKVGKTQTDAAEGSYNQLTQTMAELKKQWKATADEAERADLGKQILDINNQLKELDASTGNYQRNVGDYANAFEQAFDKCLDGIKSIDGPLGEIGGTVKNMIPIIKNINKTAVAGLSGVKKAIASTGIGLLVIAVGELITHWEDFTKIIGVSQASMAKFKEKSLNTLQSIVIGAFGVGNAIGNFLLAPIRTTIEAFKGLGNVVKSIFSGDFSQAAEDAKNALLNIGQVWNKAFDWSANMGIGKEIGYQFTERIRQAMTSPETEEVVEAAGKTTGKTATKSVVEGVKEETSNTTKAISDLWSTMFKTAFANGLKELSEEAKRRKDWLAEAMQDAVDEANQAQFDLKYGDRILTTQEEAEAEYEIEKKLIEDKIALQKTFLENFIGTAEEREKYEKDLAKTEQELQNLNVKHTKETEEQKKKDKQLAIMSSLNTAANVFGSLSELMEEGSEEQKILSIMETTISTLTGAIDAYKSMAGIPYVGPALGAAAAAAVTATGAATIAKMKATTKESANSASVAAPQVSTPSMTTVSPLLNEQADINRLDTSGMQGDSANNPMNMRVYVVDQDIRDANNRAQVVEDNATF